MWWGGRGFHDVTAQAAEEQRGCLPVSIHYLQRRRNRRSRALSMIAIVIAVLLGVIIATCGVLAEMGLFLDPLRKRAPSPGDHIKIGSFLAGGGIPNAAATVVQEDIAGVLAYFATVAPIFVLGIIWILILWFKRSWPSP